MLKWEMEWMSLSLQHSTFSVQYSTFLFPLITHTPEPDHRTAGHSRQTHLDAVEGAG